MSSSQFTVADVTTGHHAGKVAPVVVPFHVKLGVGAVAGMTGSALLYPIDRLKTALMTADTRAAGGVVATLRAIMAENGFRGLYRGLGTNLVGVAPEKAIKLGVNDYLREYFTARNVSSGLGNTLPMWQQIVAAAVAGSTQVIATNPYELLKIRMQVDASATPMGTIRRLGVAGLYRGVSATLARDVPYSIIFFPLYAALRTGIRTVSGGKVGSPIDSAATIAGGMLAGGLAAGIVTPIDVVKTRFQAPGGARRYGSVLAAARTIARDEGQAALWKGLGPRFVVVGSLYGVSMLAFELLKLHMEKKQPMA